MKSGVMSFALGLQTGGWMSALTSAKSLLAGFVSSVFSATAIIEGFRRAIERGAGLQELSKRTGESVADLYKLQRGFGAVGLHAEDVGMALFQMRKALGGINETGESTADIFKRLGLNVGQLKRMGGAEALQAIVGQMAKLNSSGQASAASSIFGRSQAQNIMQMANSMTDFQRAVTEAGAQAAVFQRVAGIFFQIDRLLDSIKSNFGNFFVNIGEGLAPALKEGAEWLQKMETSLNNIGSKIGNMFKGIAEAFKEGKLGDLLALTFSCAVDFFAQAMANTIGSGEFWDGIFQSMVGAFAYQFAIILKLFASVGTVLEAACDTAIQKILTGMAKTPLGKILGIKGYDKPQTFAENYAARKKENEGGQGVLNDVITFGVGQEITGRRREFGAIAKGMGDAMSAFDPLTSFLSGMANKVPSLPKKTPPPPPGDLPHTEKYTYKPEATAFEKMGFVMRGGAGNPALDYARRTAEGVNKMCGLLETTVQLLDNIEPGTNAI